MRNGWEFVPLGKYIKQSKKKIKVVDGEEYPAIGVMMEGRGFVTRPPFIGGKTTYKQLTPIEPDQLVLRSITAWEAPIQVTTKEHSGFHVSGVFPVFDIDAKNLNPQYLSLLCRYNPFWESMRERTVGSVLRRKTLSATALMDIPVHLPPLSEQKRIVDLISSVDSYIEALQQQLESSKRSRNAVLHELLTSGGVDWETTTIGDISDFVSVRKSPEQLSSDSIYVGLEHLEPNNTSIDNFDSVSKVTSSLTPFDVGDVLFGRLRPYLHKVAIAEMFGFCSPEILVLRANSKVLPQMLLLFCDADSTIKICVERSAGTRMPRTSTEDLASIEIKLPPIVEQIKLAELSSTFDTDISHLGIALEKSKILRSGLLSDLLSGTHEIPTTYDKVIGAA